MHRALYLQAISQGFRTSPIVALLGPRQCGKTTLARQYFAENAGIDSNYFDLEDPTDLLRLQDPLLALEDLQGLIVIDEIQRRADLFPVLRVIVDRNPLQRYLILGSASRELMKQSSESLAGRIHYREITPFTLGEVNDLKTVWLRGGFPRSYLAETLEDSIQWRKDYIKTFLEQDIPNLGFHLSPEKLRQFWMMLAHYHGQLFNATEIANAMDLSRNTIQYYLDILTGTFMIRQLAPWYENISKRQVKSKKIYFRDSGLLHSLLYTTQEQTLLTHPKIGASWEGFALETVIRRLQLDPQDCYFWATHSGAELDLLTLQNGERVGYEFKYTKAPRLTKSMHISMDDLKLDRLMVVYPGNKLIRMTPHMSAMGLEML